MFQIGQKVICLRDGWEVARFPAGFLHCPAAGQVYTIRGLTAVPDLSLYLHWLVNPVVTFVPLGVTVEPPFAVYGPDRQLNFMPIVERETNIDVFRQLLNPKPGSPAKREPVKEDA